MRYIFILLLIFGSHLYAQKEFLSLERAIALERYDMINDANAPYTFHDEAYKDVKSPFFYARTLKMLKFLESKGFSLKFNNLGNELLTYHMGFYSLSSDDKRIFHYLLDQGFTFKTHTKSNPLSSYIMWHVELDDLKYLISLGANFKNIVITPKMFQKKWYQTLLAQGYDLPNKVTQSQSSLLREYFLQGDTKSMKVLLEAGVKIPKNIGYYDGIVVSKLKEGFKLLQEYGYEINYIDPEIGFTLTASYLLDYIMTYNWNRPSYMDNLKILQELGADIHQVDVKGQNLADILLGYIDYAKHERACYDDGFMSRHVGIKEYLEQEGITSNKSVDSVAKFYKDYGKTYDCMGGTYSSYLNSLSEY